MQGVSVNSRAKATAKGFEKALPLKSSQSPCATPRLAAEEPQVILITSESKQSCKSSGAPAAAGIAATIKVITAEEVEPIAGGGPHGLVAVPRGGRGAARSDLLPQVALRS